MVCKQIACSLKPLHGLLHVSCENALKIAIIEMSFVHIISDKIFGITFPATEMRTYTFNKSHQTVESASKEGQCLVSDAAWDVCIP